MNKQLHARKRRQFKSLSKQLNRLLQGEHTRASKQKIEAVMLKIKHLLRELSGIIARWEMKKTLGAAAVMFGLATAPMQAQVDFEFLSPIENPFGLTPAEVVSFPVVADLDSDGDMDLLVGAYFYNVGSRFLYYENTGTASEPLFETGQANPFGLNIESNYAITPTIADIDNDGDLDLLVGGYEYDETTYDGQPLIMYYENIGTASNPQFVTAQDDPFGIIMFTQDYIVAPMFADIDADGDTDLIVGEFEYSYMGGNYYFENYKYFENTGTASNPQFAAPQPGSSMGLTFPPTTLAGISFNSIADLDKDGDLDIISGIFGSTYYGSDDYEYGGMFYFENTGSATSPQYTVSERNPLGITLTLPMVSNGGVMIPVLADLDDDGDTEMLTGAWYTGFHYYEYDQISGVSGVLTDFPVSVFPNPTNNYLNISTDEKLAQIEIYDLSGKQYASYDGQQTQISIQDLSAGVYMIRLINQEGGYTSRKIEKL